jgi:HlyD family secretion protein
LNEKLQFDLKVKELELNKQSNIVKEFERKVLELTVISPIDGQVGTFHVKEKDLVAASQPLMNVVDLTVFGVEIAIPESYANDLGLSMRVQINYEGESYGGELNSISPEVNNNTIEATAVFDETPAGRLRQNQRVSLKIVLQSIPDSLIVQRGPFLQSGAGRQAYVVDGDVAIRTSIEVGAISGSEVEIISGLSYQDRIIISDTSIFNNSPRVLLR